MTWDGVHKFKRLPVDITEDEFTELVKITKQAKHRVAFLLAWGAGLRVSEVLNLTQKDIDLEKKEIRVNQGKGRKDRIVPVPRGFKERHMQYIPFDFEARSIQKTFILYATKAGIKLKKPTARFHSLRHGFASQCLKKGITLKSIQMMMGHDNIAHTSVYLHLCPEDVMNEYQEKF